MKTINVQASREYNVLVGDNFLQSAGQRIAEVCGGGAAMLVADDIVNGLYGDEATCSLKNAGYRVQRFVFPHGEENKNIDTYALFLGALANAKFTRADIIVALGGGVCGDMAGFAAATYLRGIQFVQVPTTVLAMVDSSVGGKTAIDLPEGKNLVGAFYQPSLVLCDVSTLKTLPQDVFNDGCAEMIKHGVIKSSALFGALQQGVADNMQDIIVQNVTIKRDVVQQDERDTGIRQILNFGHTIGHAVEKCSAYTVTHGNAVAIGMVIASRAAHKMGICGGDVPTEIENILQKYNLPTSTQFTPHQLFEAATLDKKRSGQKITLILPKSIGECIMQSFSIDELEKFIELGLNKSTAT